MATFGEVAEVKEYELAEPGTYVCKFLPLEKIQQDAYNGQGKEWRFVFRFEAVDGNVDSKGVPFEFAEFTSTVWTESDRNKLRRMVRSLSGRSVTADEFKAIDPAVWEGQRFRVTVIQDTTEKGKDYNKIVQVKPDTSTAPEPLALQTRRPRGAKVNPSAEANADADPHGDGKNADKEDDFSDPFGE